MKSEDQTWRQSLNQGIYNIAFKKVETSSYHLYFINGKVKPLSNLLIVMQKVSDRVRTK